MPVNMRPRPVIAGKDAERFLKREKRNEERLKAMREFVGCLSIDDPIKTSPMEILMGIRYGGNALIGR